MAIRWIARVLVLAFAVIAFGFPPAAAQDRDCRDFQWQEDAQGYFEAGDGSPSYNYNWLDDDHDGVACELLPRRGWGQPQSEPDPGPDLPPFPTTDAAALVARLVSTPVLEEVLPAGFSGATVTPMAHADAMKLGAIGGVAVRFSGNVTSVQPTHGIDYYIYQWEGLAQSAAAGYVLGWSDRGAVITPVSPTLDPEDPGSVVDFGAGNAVVLIPEGVVLVIGFAVEPAVVSSPSSVALALAKAGVLHVRQATATASADWL